jgi:SAM-dependent methyltransferase
MNSEEYTRLFQVEQEHWFYRGKRDLVRHWIERFGPLSHGDLLIDGGAGTGTWLLEMSARCRVLGLDDYPESIALARPRLKAVGGSVLQTSLEKVDLPDGIAAAVTLMDVLEHVDDDEAALREMMRLVRPGGLVVVTVPALRWLWSDWDVALHHRRRYHRAGLLRLARQCGAEVLHCSYINTLALLPVALVRGWRRLRPVRPGSPRAEDRIPPRPINRLLYHSFVKPACWPWFHPPAGVSLLAVLRVGQGERLCRPSRAGSAAE